MRSVVEQSLMSVTAVMLRDGIASQSDRTSVPVSVINVMIDKQMMVSQRQTRLRLNFSAGESVA